MTPARKFIFFITGASGVGKSTLANQLRLKFLNRPDIVILGFDTIGVPSDEEMTRVYGSPSEWQRATTKHWVKKMLHEIRQPIIILEGQVNLDFIYEAFENYQFKEFKVILIDCNGEEMIRRLEHDREQPELANSNMKNWRVYLRRQAEERQVPVINTGNMSREAAIKELERIIFLEI